MLIVADDKIPFLKGVLEPFADVVYLPGKDISVSAVREADAIITRTRTRCDESLLKGSKVRFIGTATIGYDHIDTAWCQNNGIYWTNAPGCNSSSVLQYITSALLYLDEKEGVELKGKTIGIVGVGNVGSKVEQFARLMGMNVLLNDPPRARREGEGGFVTLDYLLQNSDIVTCHVPLNRSGIDSTFHLFNNENFKKMKSSSWFINSSRGEVVATEALKTSLSSGIVKGAILDVWENEPNIDIELMNMTLLSTPHIAGYSSDGKAKATSMVVNALASFFNLPISDWYPDNLPKPLDSSVIEIDGLGVSTRHIVSCAIKNVYDIEADSYSLRQNTSSFELLRGNYPTRREFLSYSVKVKNCTDEAIDILKHLGYKICY